MDHAIDCPSYRVVKAYCDARNVLSQYYYGEARFDTPTDIIRRKEEESHE